MRPCILVVAMASSVHTLRWLEMANSGSYAFVLLSATKHAPVPPIKSWPQVRSLDDVRELAAGQIGFWTTDAVPSAVDQPALPLPIGWTSDSLLVRGETVVAAVRALNPVLVHSMEVQHASYPCLQAARTMGATFPRWLVSNWGSDLYLYEKIEEHRDALRELLARASALHSECQRDAAIAHRLGYEPGRPFHVMPASGGEDLKKMPMPRTPPSARDVILIKGYHGWSGRAMHVLSAVLIAAPRLQGLRVRIVLASQNVAAMANEVARVSGLDIRVEPWSEDRQVALERMSSARIAIGIGISDGIGTSFLEAMALGAFPIAASTACACEWVRNGIDGMVVDPHDVAALADAIACAATDDAMVDAASLRNRLQVESRWNSVTNRERALRMYQATIDLAHPERLQGSHA